MTGIFLESIDGEIAGEFRGVGDVEVVRVECSDFQVVRLRIERFFDEGVGFVEIFGLD